MIVSEFFLGTDVSVFQFAQLWTIPVKILNGNLRSVINKIFGK